MANPYLSPAQRWPAQCLTAGLLVATARLSGQGAAAPSIDPADGGDPGGIVASVTRSAAGTYVVKLLKQPVDDDTGYPYVRAFAQLLNDGSATPPVGWAVVTGRASRSTGDTVVTLYVYDETQALADLDADAFIDLELVLNAGQI